jgi:adenosylcobinamide kinase/adenosylcobinamide-phosphate guanylyltransferase
MIVLVGGGVRSGKSAFALARAEALGPRRIFIATAEAGDGEMHDRITRHQAERGDRFHTVEAPLDLAGAVEQAATHADVALIDCITLWLSNLLVRDLAIPAVVERIDHLAAVLSRAPMHVVVVSNEVGMGVVPPSPLGRAFRDVAGIAHQRLAAIAGEIHLAALGVVLRLRPAPVEIGAPHVPLR